MKSKQRNLNAMIDQEGLPTHFMTFSYANTQWDDLFRLLKEYDTDLVDNMTHEERQEKIKIACENNPHVVNSFFVEKFDL